MKSNFLVQFPLVPLKIPTILYHIYDLLIPTKSHEILIWLVVSTLTLWKMMEWKSLGMLFPFPTEWKVIQNSMVPVTTCHHQPEIYPCLWKLMDRKNRWFTYKKLWFSSSLCKRLPGRVNPMNSPEIGWNLAWPAWTPPGHLVLSPARLRQRSEKAGRTNQWMIGINTNQWDLMGI